MAAPGMRRPMSRGSQHGAFRTGSTSPAGVTDDGGRRLDAVAGPDAGSGHGKGHRYRRHRRPDGAAAGRGGRGRGGNARRAASTGPGAAARGDAVPRHRRAGRSGGRGDGFHPCLGRRCATREALAAAGTAWVLGTTGLSAADEAAVAEAAQRVPVVYAPNFSPGVNLVLALAERMAAALPAGQYDAEILEMHHRQKVDAPSGTAVGLGRAVAKGRGVTLEDVKESGRDGQPGRAAPARSASPRCAAARWWASIRCCSPRRRSTSP